MSRTAAVRVPATCANLGPGFDSFGLALGLHDVFTAEEASDWRVTVEGEGAGGVPLGAENRVARGMARLWRAVGEEGRAASISSENRVPHGMGLGSSSAAVVGGLMLANALSGEPLDAEEVFHLAAEMEGHPDNAAAAVFGGLTLCWVDDGGPRATRPECAGLAAIVLLGETPLATTESRAMLPQTVPHADAAFNAGRAGLLVAGLLQGDRELVRAGLADRLHEPYRASAVPDLEELRSALLVSGADGAGLSGAGPAVIGIVMGIDDAKALSEATEVARAVSEHPVVRASGRKVVLLPIDRQGALVL